MLLGIIFEQQIVKLTLKVTFINLFALTLRAGNLFLSQIDNNMLLYTSVIT